MSDYIKRLIEKARGFVWDEDLQPVPRTERTSVHSDAFDHLSYEMLTDSVPNLRKSIDDLKQEHRYVEPAYEDLFNLLHQGAPMFKERAEMLEEYEGNHAMLSALAQTPEVDNLRTQTARDDWATAFGMLAMEPEMRSAFERMKDARDAAIQAHEQAAQAQQGLQDAIAGAQQPGADPDAAAAALQEAMDAAQAADQAQQATQAALAQVGEQGSDAVAQAVQAAAEDLQEQQQLAGAYGVDPGQLRSMPFEERRRLMEQLDSTKLRKLAALVGAFRRFGDAERRRKVKHAPSEISDVEIGNDLHRLIPEELVRMAIPELEDLFWLGYAQKELMQWEVEGTENLGQGPIIVVCDESGSMNDQLNAAGTREMWSKALSLALSDQAARGKRDFIYIGFSSHGQVWEKHFPGGRADIADVVEFVSHFFGGGTSYEAPLARAQEIVREYGAAGKAKPDVVFITDDDCRISDRFVEGWQTTRAELDMTCYGIQIGSSRTANAMPRLCDSTVLLTSLNAKPEGMQDLFRTI